MKKVISISLAFLMLVSNIGFAMNTHFCGGVAVETTFTLGLGNPDCGMEDMEQECQNMPLQQEQLKSKPCCENQHQVLQVDDTAKPQTGTSNINPVFFAALIHSYIIPLSFADERQKTYTDYSPPLPDKDIPILFQAFLI